MDWIEDATKEEEHRREIISFDDYMGIFKGHPWRECRPTFAYLKDMLHYFGKDDKDHFKIFRVEHIDAPAVYGQYSVEQALIQNLLNFAEEGFNNKFILLVGPNGSSKSSIVKKLMKGAEEYSKADEGALYSFNWIFPVDNFVKGTMGLSKHNAHVDISSFAHLEDKDISAILGSELKDHPLLLIPIKHRRSLIDTCLADDSPKLEAIQKSYLYNGDLSKRNRMIYDALLNNYKGRHQDVLKHIRVERFKISQRYSSAAVTVEPQLHIDARMQQITMDKRLASLPPSLQSLNLFSLSGEAVLANRGILEFSDLLKRPLDSYKYLLMTMETKNLNLQGILTELDIFFIGTSNEVHLTAFKQHPDFGSFKGRFNFVRVPYLLDVNEETKIYKKQVEGLRDHTGFGPHAVFSLCLFAVLSRLRCPQSKNYTNKKLGDIITSFNPIEKALFIANNEMPERLDMESRQLLSAHMNEVLGEFYGENLYEGKFGLSPRDIKNIIYKLARRSEVVTFVEVVEYLHKLINKKSEYDFLGIPPQGDYHHPSRFISLIKDYGLAAFDKELRDSLGMVDERSYEDHIKKYIENITAMIKGEKIKNPITGRFEKCDSFFIEEFEGNIELKEDPDTFRGHLLSRVGAYSLDHPGKKIRYTEVFGDLTKKLRQSFRKEQGRMIKDLAKHLVFFEAELNGEDSSGLDPEKRRFIETVLENLHNKYEHPRSGALTALKCLIKERY